MKGPFRIPITFILGALLIGAIACSASTDAPSTRPSDGQPVAAQPPVSAQPGEPTAVEEPAPIESVRIDKVAAKPPNASLVVVSGLPNSCYELGGHTVTRDDESFDVTITNLLAGGPDVACAELYRTVETSISLDEPGEFFGQIETCKVYDVTVNGEIHSVQAIDPSVRCAAPGTRPGDAAGTASVPAPIASVVINIAESFPPQYFAQVRSGLPNGCARFDAFDVTRDGDVIRIEVTNLVPAAPNTICTQVYGAVENKVALGSDFEGGKKYTVIVNDVTEPFVAQGATPTTPPDEGNRLGVPFTVAFDETAVIGSEGLVIHFASVTEDSRCAVNVVCVWAGRARIQVGVSQNGESLGQHELALENGIDDLATRNIGDYRLRLSVLDPYPGTTAPIAESDYIATLIVAETASDTPEAITVAIGRKFELEPGQAATIESEGLEVRFIEVANDSRCPIGANCIVAGQASVLVGVTADGLDLGPPRKLVLDAGREEQRGHRVGEYSITIVALEPHPGLGSPQGDAQVVTLVVTK